MYYSLLRKILFKMNPEYAHQFSLKQLHLISKTPLKSLIYQKTPLKPVTCMGLTFKNPLGLAAGIDKNGEYINILGKMGFGFIEIGTVTPLPQKGENKPRLFRLLETEGLINRMGFNNLGIDYLVSNIKKKHFDGILGVNIGKNKNTPIEYGKDDYILCIEKVYSYADYIAINISSPNTPGLRLLQYNTVLDNLLISIKEKQNDLKRKYRKYVPIVVKISPDLSKDELNHIVNSFLRNSVDGIIATNTTIDRSLIKGMKHCNKKGGLSGRPIQLKSTNIISYLSSKLNGRLPIIGVGGIESIISAREKIAAGASLIQICSGFIFKGPSLIKEIISYI